MTNEKGNDTMHDFKDGDKVITKRPVLVNARFPRRVKKMRVSGYILEPNGLPHSLQLRGYVLVKLIGWNLKLDPVYVWHNSIEKI